MKNIGSINGKIEILVDRDPIPNAPVKTVALIGASNYVEFTPYEILDLADVVSYAATDQLHLLPECPNFQRKEDNAPNS